MAVPIIARVVRGRLYFQIADCLFETFAAAVSAWAAAEAHRLDIAERIVQRTEALADMRRAGDDMVGFSAASKREAHLAAHIRQVRRAGGAA